MTLMKKCEKPFKILITLFLVFLTLISVKQEAVPTVNGKFQVSHQELISTAEKSDISILQNADGTITLSATEEGKNGSVALPGGVSPDAVFVRCENKDIFALTAIYIKESKPDTPDTVYGAPLKDGGQLFLLYEPAMGTVRLQVPYGKQITINEIWGLSIEGYTTKYTPNIPALIALALIILCLVLTERRFCYFANIIKFAKRMAGFEKQLLCSSGGKCRFVLHISSLAVLAAFAILAAVKLLFGIMQINYLYTMLGFGVVAIFAGLYVLYTENKLKPSSALIVSLSVIGALAVLSVGINLGTCWDDAYHFTKSAYPAAYAANFGYVPLGFFELAVGNCFIEEFTLSAEMLVGNLLYFGELPTAVIDTGAAINAFLSLPPYMYVIGVLLLPFIIVYFLFGFCPYIPSLVLFFTAGLFGADILKIFFLAKLANLAVYSAFVYLAVRRMRSGAYLFSAIALIPACIFLAGSFSADWWITSLCMLGLSYVFGAFTNPKSQLSGKDIVIMLCALALASGPKEIYCIMLLPVLFIPREKYKNKAHIKPTRVVAIVCMCLIVLSFAVPFLVNTGAASDFRGGDGIDATEQLKFILQNPLEYAKIFFGYVIDYTSLIQTNNNLSLLGWFGYGSGFFSGIILVLLLYFAFTDKHSDDIMHARYGRYRLLFLGNAAAVLVLIVTSLYITYTPVGHHTVNGCQYRYLFPLFPLALFALIPKHKTHAHNENVKCLISFSVLSLASILSLCGVLLGIPFGF